MYSIKKRLKYFVLYFLRNNNKREVFRVIVFAGKKLKVRVIELLKLVPVVRNDVLTVSVRDTSESRARMFNTHTCAPRVSTQEAGKPRCGVVPVNILVDIGS